MAHATQANWNYTDTDLQLFAQNTNKQIAFTQSFGPASPAGLDVRQRPQSLRSLCPHLLPVSLRGGITRIAFTPHSSHAWTGLC